MKIKEYSGTVSRATGEVVKDLSQKRQEKVVSLSERKSQRDANRNSNGKKYA